MHMLYLFVLLSCISMRNKYIVRCGFQGKLVEGDFGTALPLIIFGGLSVVAGLLSLILPETKGKVLPETIADAEQFGW